MEAVGDPQDERMVQVSLTYEDGEGERQALARNNSDLRSENLALRQEVESLATEIDHLWIPSAEKWMEEANRLRAAGDALAAHVRDHGYGTDTEHAVLTAWQEARREQ